MTLKSFKLRARSFRSQSGNAVSRELLQGIWRIRLGDVANTSAAYLDHCNELRGIFAEEGFAEANRNDIIGLVDVIRKSQEYSIGEIITEIRAANPKWAHSISDDESAQNVLSFAVQLWLFIEPDLSDPTRKLSEAVKKSLPTPGALATHQRWRPCVTTSSAPASCSHPEDFWYLPSDFCEKSLTRKAAIKLEWTSDLSYHLTFIGKSRLRIFRHASAIQQAATSPKDFPYPPGFLEETERTLALLFDPADRITLKRTRRIERRHKVDLEAAMNSVRNLDDRLDLRKYPFWQERLRVIQKTYDEAQPKTIRQWFFDDRNRINWATFWTAVIIFALTVIFGIVSSVTGVMQVYIAFNLN